VTAPSCPGKPAVVLVAALVWACSVDNTDDLGVERLSGFSIVVLDAPDAPIALPDAFAGHEHMVFVDIEARDGAGRVVPIDGDVLLTASPAGVTGEQIVELEGGEASYVRVDLLQPYGRTAIWVVDSVREGATNVFGSSAPLVFENPTLAQLQATTNAWNSPLECNGAEGEPCHYITIDRGTLIVTNIAGDGFNVTDIDDDCRSGEPDDACFNHLYVFSYSFPEGVERGQCICRVSGIVQEYIGFTELSQPEWDSTGDCDACRAVEPIPPPERIPEPVVIDGDDLGESMRMESLEAALIRVHDVEVLRTGATYAEYAQWQVGLPEGARLNVVSEATVPHFDPSNEEGTVLSSMTGNLKDIGPARPRWVLIPRAPDDLVR